MKKLVQTILLLFVCMSINAQPFNKSNKVNRISKSNITRSTQNKVQPSRSLLYYSYDSSRVPDTLSYDRFGNMTERISNSRRDFDEYDAATGTLLLNSIEYSREAVTAPWVESSVELRTTVNSQGIRTSLQSEDYKDIQLNGKGYVVSYDDSDGDQEIDKATYTWEGDKLKSVVSEFKMMEEGKLYEEIVTLNDINVIYEKKPFNCYEIDYTEYLMYLNNNGVAINATGTYAEGKDSPAHNISFASVVSEDKKMITTEYNFGEFSSTQKMTYTDDNGSYVFELSDSDGSRELNTVTCNEYGDVTSNNYQEIQEGEKGYIRNVRYVWTYNEGKPTKLETYAAYKENETEQLESTEVFLTWYDGAGIGTVQQDIRGEVLGAILYTLSGTQVRILSAEQAKQAVELPGNGIYMLKIQTSEGTVVKKLIK